MLGSSQELRHCHQFSAGGSTGGRHVEHHLYHGVEVLRVLLGQALVLPFKDAFEQTLHILCLERRPKCNHLVDDTAQRPYIALKVVRLIAPDLRTSIVRSTCLRVVEAALIS